MMNRKQMRVLPFFFALAMTGCNHDDIPTNFIGFEKGNTEWIYDTNKTAEEFSLKIITGSKTTEDIPLIIHCPNRSLIKLKTSNPHIPKGKKETTVTFELYSSKIEKRMRFINITCAPKKDPKQSTKISVRLKSKM